MYRQLDSSDPYPFSDCKIILFQRPSGRTSRKGEWRDISLDHRICTDYGSFANRRSRSNRHPISYPDIASDYDLLVTGQRSQIWRNRPDTTRRVFEAIVMVRPARLLLVADGPRSGKTGETEVCQQVREIIAHVDWPCEVSTNFSDKNLGCGERMISGLNWVFSLVEEAIILEDDCLPDASFFPFCAGLLERYRGDSRIAYISGCNLVEKHLNTIYSYFFSQIGGIWGWATWRSEWQRCDRYLSDWPALRNEKMLSEIFDQPKAVAYWTRIFDAMHEKRGPNTWDYQWLYTCLKNNSLIAVPSVNLVANIGFGDGGTHTTQPDARFMPPTSVLEFPLKHPSDFVPLRSIDRLLLRDIFVAPISYRLLRIIRRVTKRVLQRC